MATKKEIRGVIVPRHDTAINWSKAVNFTPENGELIIISADDATDVARGYYLDSEGNKLTSITVNSNGVDKVCNIEPSDKVRFKFGNGEDNVNALPFQTHVQGKYNIEDSSSIYADIIGNGSSDTERSNAYTLDWNGNAWYAGDVYVGSTSGTHKDEGSKKLATEDTVDSKVDGALGDTSISLDKILEIQESFIGDGQGSISGLTPIDSEMSDTSENPVQNKVIKAYVDSHSGGGGISITVDSEISDTSENPVQNKVIKAYIDSHSGGSVTIDSELSDISENPVQNKVINAALGDISSALSAIVDGTV